MHMCVCMCVFHLAVLSLCMCVCVCVYHLAVLSLFLFGTRDWTQGMPSTHSWPLNYIPRSYTVIYCFIIYKLSSICLAIFNPELTFSSEENWNFYLSFITEKIMEQKIKRVYPNNSLVIHTSKTKSIFRHLIQCTLHLLFYFFNSLFMPHYSFLIFHYFLCMTL